MLLLFIVFLLLNEKQTGEMIKFAAESIQS